MEAKHIRYKILYILFTIVLCITLISAGMAVTLAESDDPWVPVNTVACFLKKDIYLDGRHINNWELEKPFLILDNMTYAPVDGNNNIIADALGECVCDLCDKNVSVGYNEIVDGFQGDRRDVLYSEDGSKYYSLQFLSKAGLLSVAYTSESGLYISTDKNVSAESYLQTNPNRDYISGRCAYMMHINPNLTKAEALDLEYLMRHVAATTEGISQDFLMAVVRSESGFNVRIGTKAVGLMQVLLKYANQAGYDYDGITDPHTNLHYGAACLMDGLKKFNGDKVLALSAYNLGTYRVLSMLNGEEEPISLSYARSVYDNESSLRYWISSKGYTNEFVETIGN